MSVPCKCHHIEFPHLVQTLNVWQTCNFVAIVTKGNQLYKNYAKKKLSKK